MQVVRAGRWVGVTTRSGRTARPGQWPLSRLARVGDNQLGTLLAQRFKVVAQALKRRQNKRRRFVLTFVPPLGEASLGIDVDQSNGALTNAVSLNG